MVFKLHFAIPLRFILWQKCYLKTTGYRNVERLLSRSITGYRRRSRCFNSFLGRSAARLIPHTRQPQK